MLYNVQLRFSKIIPPIVESGALIHLLRAEDRTIVCSSSFIQDLQIVRIPKTIVENQKSVVRIDSVQHTVNKQCKDETRWIEFESIRLFTN